MEEKAQQNTNNYSTCIGVADERMGNPFSDPNFIHPFRDEETVVATDILTAVSDEIRREFFNVQVYTTTKTKTLTFVLLFAKQMSRS